ncbi:alpha/beta-hydrolase [Leucogyrophana mollusca]|uniref:Alpha/beta-hydrolase n=1 Tax=Leucogyrophana mollusca TaxID=85980 RepID=A0ACB8B5R0_9AGAM|nr:alpha/beta-hydrolase [Leucogyrophana mollusca]
MYSGILTCKTRFTLRAFSRTKIIDLGYASYQGSVDTATNITSFLGIRYAAPPVGDLRWAAPQPPATVSGVQQATEQPNECYQAPTGNASTNPLTLSKRAVSESEDCLFLNVYTPGDAVTPASSGEGLPVVVWIHGGGYIAGAASSFNGADLIVDANYGVVTVLIQYRLGVFGVLSPSISSSSDVNHLSLLTCASVDQNYALQWVQAHIAAFGGDPTKVTIWGESAGAGSVLQHLVAHAGNTQPPLFRAAMTSSTFLPSQYGYNERIPEMLYNEVATGANCTTLACLRATPVDTLQTLNTEINLSGFYGTFVFVPVVDGTFIVERPTVTIGRGKLNGEALLSVTNTYEGTIFVDLPAVANTDVTTYASTLFPNFGPEQAMEAAGVYGATMLGATDDALAIGVMGESIFICPTYYLLEAFGSRAWKGEFAIPPGEHGNDIPYYFTSQGPPYNNSQFITAFSGGFMSFATSLDINQKVYADDITPQWDAWTVGGRTEMLFNETAAGAPVVQTTTTDAAVLERCARHTGLFAQLALSLGVYAPSAPTVDLGYASYQGSVDTATNITSFLGIRYAAPPVGDLRWAAPRPPATVSGVQQATQQPNQCYQAPGDFASTNASTLSERAVSESEDCLFLNVYTPGDAVAPASSGEGLPVVVWIHGGGYVVGSASSFNGADLIVDANYGVITVLIQYRLGVFGFLSGEAIKEGGALNAGLLDQNYALQWVQAHIAAFGGDPTKVTIWGESAGAGSVIQHLVAHAGNTQPPLFKAAMTGSTFLPSQYGYNERIPEMIYNEVSKGANCTTLACLRAAPADILQTLNNKISPSDLYTTFVFVPVVDGTFIVERPTVTIGKGKLNGDVLLSVTNTYEGSIFVDPPAVANTDVATYASTIFPDFGPEQANEAARVYEATMPGASNDALAIAVNGESIFICPTYYILEAFESRAWKGEFAIPPGEHGADIAYYFTSQGPKYNNSQFITAFSGGFMSFAASLDVNQKVYAGDITPQWDAWTVGGRTEMLFNETEAGAPAVQPKTTDAGVLERCAFWRSVSAYTAQ